MSMHYIIDVAQVEFSEGGKAIWVHDAKGSTVLRIQCSGRIEVHDGCVNNCPHADINASGNIDICIPTEVKCKRPKAKQTPP